MHNWHSLSVQPAQARAGGFLLAYLVMAQVLTP